jgi:hypothetical protein
MEGAQNAGFGSNRFAFLPLLSTFLLTFPLIICYLL